MEPRVRSTFYVGMASRIKPGVIYISQNGTKWMRMKNKRCHFWQHAVLATEGEAARLEQGDYVTFSTTCTACHRECYEEDALQFISTHALYNVAI